MINSIAFPELLLLLVRVCGIKHKVISNSRVVKREKGICLGANFVLLSKEMAFGLFFSISSKRLA